MVHRPAVNPQHHQHLTHVLNQGALYHLPVPLIPHHLQEESGQVLLYLRVVDHEIPKYEIPLSFMKS